MKIRITDKYLKRQFPGLTTDMVFEAKESKYASDFAVVTIQELSKKGVKTNRLTHSLALDSTQYSEQ